MAQKGYVTIRLDDTQRAQLEERAAEAERSLSAEIRVAIRKHLASNNYMVDVVSGRTVRSDTQS